MNSTTYPPIPAGYHRWEPRPRGWKSDGEVKFAFLSQWIGRWQVMPGTAQTVGHPEADYLEAVRDEPGPTVEDHANDCRKAIKAMVESEAASRVSGVEPGKPTRPAERPTPRTDAAYFSPGATMYSLAGESKKLERELAEAADARKVLEDAADLLNGLLRQEDQRKQRVLTLLQKARDHSGRMDMVAYAAIQDAINELATR